VRQAQQALADEVPTLPISAVLDVVIYNTAKIGGPVKAPPPGGLCQSQRVVLQDVLTGLPERVHCRRGAATVAASGTTTSAVRTTS
jgi:hypothetical protein